MSENEPRTGIRLDLFGGPKVLRDGRPVELSPYQLALLTVIAAHGTSGLARPRVGWLMWQEDDTPRVRHRIRQLLHRIHQAAGCTIVVGDGDQVRIAGGIECDIAKLEHLVTRRSCAEAAGLLLRGFASRLEKQPSAELEDWLLARGRALLEEVRALASRKWDEASAAGLWGDARDAAEALCMLAPDEVGAVEKLVEARARTGSVALAEEAFARYRERVGEDAVTSRLEELVERVRKLRAAPATIELGTPEPPPPLVGRASALEQARAIFEPVRAGQFGFVLVTGEGGIGKTRVLGALKDEALLEGFRCLHARSSEAERRIPLNSLVDALSEVDLGPHLRRLGEPWKSILGAFLPVGSMQEPLEEVPPIQEANLSRRLLDALRFLLQELAREEPTLLLLDDLQWADATSVTALKFIQRRWTGDPLGVIATARAELVPHDEPAAEYLTSKDDLPVTRIELHELAPAEGATLVRHLVGEDAGEEVVRRLCELGGLHPLYLTELGKDFAAGRLELPRIPADQVPIPVSLQEILRARIERLSSTALNVAGLIAVRGRPMRLRELAGLTGLPLEDYAGAVEELLALRLAAIETDRVRIAHELFRSALYRHLSEPRRIVIHRAIGEMLAAAGADDTVAGELAMHFARAGDRSLAARHGWKAGARAMDNGALAEAAYYYELVAENEDDPRRQADATAELGRALHLSRSMGRANPVLELAAVRLREVGDPVKALRMDIRRVEGLAEEGTAKPADLLYRLHSIKQEAEALGDLEGVALALDVELRFAHHEEDLARIAALFQETRHLHERSIGAARTLAASTLALSVLSSSPSDALAFAQEAVELTPASSEYRLRILNRYIIAHYHRGALRSSAVRGAIAEARAIAGKSGDMLERFNLENNVAAELMDSGYLDEAEVGFAAAEQLLRGAEMMFPQVSYACNVGELALAKGDYARAREQYSRAGEFLGPAVPRYVLDFVNAGMGLCAIHEGDLREARRREHRLREPPPHYFYDPTPILAFRVRLLEWKGETRNALEMLQHAADDVAGRLLLAWLKVRGLQARVALRHRIDFTDEIEEALALAKELEIGPREAELGRLLKRSRQDLVNAKRW